MGATLTIKNDLTLDQLDRLEKALKEDHLSPDRLGLMLDIIEEKLSFYKWHANLSIKGDFLEALIIQMELDHGHDIDFDLLHTSDYRACWSKVLDGLVGKGEK